jgi:hypothetical protein
MAGLLRSQTFTMPSPPGLCFTHMSSPLAGEDTGGGYEGHFTPHPNLPPPGGKGHKSLQRLALEYLWAKFRPAGEGKNYGRELVDDETVHGRFMVGPGYGCTSPVQGC